MRRLSRLHVGAAVATLVTSGGLLLAQPAAHADPSTYSPTIQVTAGANDHSQVPVTVTLPPPGDGISVAQVTFNWDQPSPTMAGSVSHTTYQTTATPECVADQECVVTRTLSTARMANGNARPVFVAVSDGTQLLGTSSVLLDLHNPKPSVAFTVPADNNTTAWGMVTLSADAAPGTGDVPLAGVRFYAHSTGKESDAYVFDDTAPYSVEVPATDIAVPAGADYVYAVAEDTEGNLTAVQRRITVGPPADAAFTIPGADDLAAGSTVQNPVFGLTASIPDVVPAYPGNPPYLKRIQVLIDGNAWADLPFDVVNPYSQPKPRSVAFNLEWRPNSAPAPGSHVATMRVTTSYGSVAVTERRFVVNDGVIFGSVTDAGHQVNNGYVVTGGTTHKLTTTMHGKYDALLTYWDLRDQAGMWLNGPNGCDQSQPSTCPEQVTLTRTWTAPDTAGHYTLTWEAQAQYDTLRTMTRTVVVQARGAIRASTPTPNVEVGHRATVVGEFTRTDTGRGVRGVKVELQWRRAGTSSWVTLGTSTTNSSGRVTAYPLRPHTGYYRWVTHGIWGKVSGATSRQVRVNLYR